MQLSLLQTSLILGILSSTALSAVAKVPVAYGDQGSAAQFGAAAASSPSAAPYAAAPGTKGVKGTPTGSSPASSSTRAYVHFDCGTHIHHGSDHFLDTIHGMHTGVYPNGTEYNTTDPSASSHSSHSGSAAAATYGGQYDPHSANGISKVRRALSRALGKKGSRQSGSSKINVDAYMHVVTTKAHAGMVTQPQIVAQIAALNAAYNPHGIYFRLANTSFTVNDAWAVGGSDNVDLAMKGALRQGTYADLNLYFQSDMAGGVLGQCTLPTNVGDNPSPSVYVRDGCNIAAGTVPKGPINGYNMGMTAVHETGHWLGLLHTFEGYTCSGNGDFVADTPSESQSTDGCPTSPWKNTCSGRAGLDPIHNYMDYSTDACYSRFTPGQEQRIRSLWPQYRQGK